MKVEVALDKWGTYTKGTPLEMAESTAKACMKAGAVKEPSKKAVKAKVKLK